MDGLGGGPLQPGAHCRLPAGVEAALVGYVRVGVEGDAGYRVAVADEEIVALQTLLHDPEGGVSEPPLGLERSPALLGHSQGVKPRPSTCPYAPECVEGRFSELRA
jgi:hypothetical protein